MHIYILIKKKISKASKHNLILVNHIVVLLTVANGHSPGKVAISPASISKSFTKL